MTKIICLMLVCSLHVAVAETFDITLNVPSRGNVALRLERHDAFAPGSRIQVMTPRGVVLVDPASVRVYRGSLPNEPKSIVVLAVSRSGVVGTIDAVTERFDVHRDARDVSATSVNVSKTSVNVSKTSVTVNNAQPRPCAVVEEKLPDELLRIMHEKPSERVQDAETLEMQIAVEADNQFFRENESNRDKALAYIAQVVGATSAIYERDFNVRITTSNVRLWEDPSDPYQESGSSGELLEAFVAHYEATMSNVQRDMAVYMTMRGGLGGVAKSIGGICESGSSYCFGDLNGDLAKAPNEYSWDQVLFAHEIGHVCGAIHTQNCFWPGGPIDSCVNSEGGTCVRGDQTRPIIGTIMSYCHLRQFEGGGIVAEFHPRHKQVVRSYLERATCVGARSGTKNSVLRGRLINYTTQTGIAGAELRIRVFKNDLFIGTVSPGPDSIKTTGADGSFEFTGLSDGVYTVVLPDEWAITPITINAAEQGVNIIVSENIVQYDINVVSGRPVSLELNTGGDATDITITLVSQNLEALVEVVPVPGIFAALGVPYVQTVPIGSYTIVPHAVGRRFTPLYIDVDVTASGPPAEVSFVSSSTAPDTTAPIIAISTINNEGVYALAVGDEVEIMHYLDSTGTKRPTGTNGVVVFENLHASAYYLTDCFIDTADWVPSASSRQFAFAGNGYPVIFEKRERQFPLIARPYQLVVTTEKYESVAGAERIIGPDAFASGDPVPRTLPFDISFGPERSSKVFVYPSGDLVFGQNPVGTYETPVMSYTNADFIISVMSPSFFAPYTIDSTDLDNTGVWFKITGEAPNRVVSVEWRKLAVCDGFGSACKGVGTVTFQVHIEEHSGIIRMVYGVADPADQSVPVYVGLRGRDKLDVRALASEISAWSTPETTSNASDVLGFLLHNENHPVEGLTYTWLNAAVSVDEDASAQASSRHSSSRADAIRISPSPASDALTVKGLPEGARLRLVDMLGRGVLTPSALKATANASNTSRHLVSTTAYFDVSALASGHYLLLVETDGATIAKTVMVNH